MKRSDARRQPGGTWTLYNDQDGNPQIIAGKEPKGCAGILCGLSEADAHEVLGAIRKEFFPRPVLVPRPDTNSGDN